MAVDQLTQAQGRLCGSGPFEAMDANLAGMHDALVASIGRKRDEAWLDLACGTGGVASRAAAAGAKVTGVDLAPALIETARRRAAEAGLEIEYEVGDAEDLRFDDGAFNAITSSVGVIFAPRHQVAAAELARVCAPGAESRSRPGGPTVVSVTSSGSCAATSRRCRKGSATRSTGAWKRTPGRFSVSHSTWRYRPSIRPS